MADRGAYDRATVHAVLDAARLCHVGFVVDGQPFVIPTLYGRTGDRLFIHGSPASRMLRSLAKGVEICLTATVVDGLVLARSAFHHSVNYRSVAVFGVAHRLDDPAAKEQAMRAISEHVLPGRWSEARPPTAGELRGVTVLELALDDASAKVRVGPPRDDEDDYALPVWAGEVPLVTVAGAPVADPRLDPAVGLPPSVRSLLDGHTDGCA